MAVGPFGVNVFFPEIPHLRVFIGYASYLVDAREYPFQSSHCVLSSLAINKHKGTLIFMSITIQLLGECWYSGREQLQSLLRWEMCDINVHSLNIHSTDIVP